MCWEKSLDSGGGDPMGVVSTGGIIIGDGEFRQIGEVKFCIIQNLGIQRVLPVAYVYAAAGETL
jgi:hypothetical protein